MRRCRFYRICLFAALVFAASVLTACSPEIITADPSVKSITVDGMSRTDSYFDGDELNLDGVRLVVSYSDGKTETVSLDKNMLSDYDMSVPEENKFIGVKYKGAETGFHVNVYDSHFSDVRLTSLPYKTRYVEGESVNGDGAVVTVYYEGGKEVPINVTDRMFRAYDNAPGTRDIYMSFRGRELFFPVEFIEKTPVEIIVTDVPLKNSVFIYKGEELSLEGMTVKITYDNGAALRQKVSEGNFFADNMKIFIDDTYVGATNAKVLFLPENYPETITYDFTGNALVEPGEIVRPYTDLASDERLENVKSKSHGKVLSVSDGKIVVDTVMSYSDLTECKVKKGQIVMPGEEIGRRSGKSVKTDGGGLITDEPADGVVKIRFAPVCEFSLNVKERGFKSMEILEKPHTEKFKSKVENEPVIQGDVLDLSTGTVKVTFDNDESERLAMDAKMLRVINEPDPRNEIDWLTFEADDMSDLPAGAYDLSYTVVCREGHKEDDVDISISVVDDSGKSVYVQKGEGGSESVSLEEETNYTVSLSAKYVDPSTGKTLVDEYSYHLASENAEPRRKKLDISAAGKHTIKVYYGENESHGERFTVIVNPRYAKKIIISQNGVSGRTFIRGREINLAESQYRIEYNNGDVSEPAAVTKDMLYEGNLTCETQPGLPVTPRTIVLKPPKGVYLDKRDPDDPGRELTSEEVLEKYPGLKFELKFFVRDKEITGIDFLRYPADIFATDYTEGSGRVDIDFAGALMEVVYEDGEIDEFDGAASNGLADDNRLYIEYNEQEQGRLVPRTPDEIYLDEDYKPYKGVLTYEDKYGVKIEKEFEFHYVSSDFSRPSEAKPESIAVEVRRGAKLEYVQYEDWALDDVRLRLIFADGSYTYKSAEPYMVRKDITTDKAVENLSVAFSYLGVEDKAPHKYEIDVKPRTEEALILTFGGETERFTTAEFSRGDVNFGRYKFTVKYNSGAPQDNMSGPSEFVGAEGTVGWWFEFEQIGENGEITTKGVWDRNTRDVAKLALPGKKNIILHHTATYEDEDGSLVYSRISASFEIEVRDVFGEIERIAYELETDDPPGPNSPLLEPTFALSAEDGATPVTVNVLEEVAQKEPLMLREYGNDILKRKKITVYYYKTDGSKFDGHFVYQYEETDDYGVKNLKYYIIENDGSCKDLLADGPGEEIAWTADKERLLERSYTDITPEMVNYHPNDITLGYRRADISYKGKTCVAAVKAVEASLSEISVVKEPLLNYIGGAGADLDLTNGVLRCKFVRSDGSSLFKYLEMSDPAVSAKGFNPDLLGDSEMMEQTVELTYKGCSASYKITIYNKQELAFRYQNTLSFYGNSKETRYIPKVFIAGFEPPADDDIKMHYLHSDEIVETLPDDASVVTWPDDGASSENTYIRLKVKKRDGSVIDLYAPTNALRDTHPYQPAGRDCDWYIVMSVKGNDFYATGNYAYEIYTIIPRVIDVKAPASNESAYIEKYTINENEDGTSHRTADAVNYLYENKAALNALFNDRADIISSVEMYSPNYNPADRVGSFEIALNLTTSFEFGNPDHIAVVERIFADVKILLEDNVSDLRGHISIGDRRKGVNIYDGPNPVYPPSYQITRGETLTYNGILELLSGGAELEIGADGVKVTVGSLGHDNYTVQFISAKMSPRKVLGFGFNPAYPSTPAAETSLATVTVRIPAETIGEKLDEIIRVLYAEDEERYLTKEELIFKMYDIETAEEGETVEGGNIVAGIYKVKVRKGLFASFEGDELTEEFILKIETTS